MNSIFNLEGKIALITGGAGVLGSNFANVLAKQGVIVGIVSQSLEKAESTVKAIEANGGKGFAVQANVLNKEELEKIKDFIVEKYGRLDILINAAGGNMPGATIQPDQAIYDMKSDDLQKVIDLNIIGTMLPSQVFLRTFCETEIRKYYQHFFCFGTKAFNESCGLFCFKSGNRQLYTMDGG
ncbi:SDR family NAD(P)-dependent oxidoreductase [Flavobacterium ginsengisoli]|uniref:SDR family NAD(P)-dependent oxidoreductase n=1 Tax=Flavobacterium ginsengisoli TaxID=871694 RepID=UPI0024153EE0|nr:SDR family NAD(P)-dependent oxidoreductase [Flavobacterium ginsengisoli]